MKTWLAAAALIILSLQQCWKNSTPGQVLRNRGRQADVVAIGNGRRMEMERMRRIALDFNKTEEEDSGYIRRFSPISHLNK